MIIIKRIPGGEDAEISLKDEARVHFPKRTIGSKGMYSDKSAHSAITGRSAQSLGQLELN